MTNPTNTDGLVDVDAKWLTMAKLCFATSVMISVFMVLSGIATIIKPDNGFSKLPDCCTALMCPAFTANCILIPVVIFSDYSKGCIEPGEKEGPYDAEYKGFKLIWILMLALTLGLFALFFLLICCAGVGAICLACCMKKEIEEGAKEIAKEHAEAQ